MSKGGPIIAFQLENEYGSYGDDVGYKEFLRYVRIFNTILASNRFPKRILIKYKKKLHFDLACLLSKSFFFCAFRHTRNMEWSNYCSRRTMGQVLPKARYQEVGGSNLIQEAKVIPFFSFNTDLDDHRFNLCLILVNQYKGFPYIMSYII